MPVEPAGALNFRDLGGLPAGPGRRTRSGVLFRSDTLQALTDDDVALLVERLGLEAVFDLRVGAEAVEQGRGPLVGHAVTYLNAPLREAAPNDEPAERQALLFSLMHLEAPTSVLGSVVRSAAAFAGRPMVVHCAAGKDRTGLVVTLLLALAGVDRQAIVADYLASGPNMVAIMRRFRDLAPLRRAHGRDGPRALPGARAHRPRRARRPRRPLRRRARLGAGPRSRRRGCSTASPHC